MSTNRQRNGQFAKRQTVGLWLLGIVTLGLILFALSSGYVDRYFGFTYEAPKETVKEITVETTPEWAEDPDAVEAAQAVIKKKELEKKLAGLETDRETLVAEYEQKLANLDAEIASTSNELAAY